MTREDLAEEKTDRTSTYLCTLRFRDGQVVTAQIEAASPYENCPVSYTGAVERLPFRFDTADSVLLKGIFQSCARKLNARFKQESFQRVRQSGEGLADATNFTGRNW